MDFFGIGWLELFFIFIIVLLVAGPKDIEKGAKGLGRFINKLNRSPSFQAIRRASTELRNLPQRLAKEANLEELQALSQEVQQVKQDVQQVKQEINANTSNITGTHKTFQAWVQEIPPSAAADAASAPTLPADSDAGPEAPTGPEVAEAHPAAPDPAAPKTS
jgi:Sec-independent protein translocase protein TatA